MLNLLSFPSILLHKFCKGHLILVLPVNFLLWEVQKCIGVSLGAGPHVFFLFPTLRYTYFCRVVAQSVQFYTLALSIFLSFFADSPSFAISREPGFGIPIREGIPVSLKCDVDSNPPSSPVWQKGKFITIEKRRVHSPNSLNSQLLPTTIQAKISRTFGVRVLPFFAYFSSILYEKLLESNIYEIWEETVEHYLEMDGGRMKIQSFAENGWLEWLLKISSNISISENR